MSRQIDLSRPDQWSDHDIIYLRQRGRIDQVAMVDAELARRRKNAPASSMEAEDSVEEEPYEAWTNEELRTELRNRQLSTDGKKDDLIARLEEDDQRG